MPKKDITCLVVIDMQNEFLTEETSSLSEKILDLISRNSFDYIIGTQFYNYKGSPFDKILDWHGCMCEPAIEIDRRIRSKCDKIFIKSTYSCFTDNFIDFLQNKKINKLFFVGVDTDGCVLISAVDAFSKNIDFRVLIDYCASTGGKENHNAGIKVLERLVGPKCIKKEKP